MVGCIEYNTMLDVGTFYCDKKAELKKLPNLTDNGKENLANMNSVKCGSQCLVLEDKNVYLLTGNNTWEVLDDIDIHGGGSGEGGGDGADWADGYEDEDIDFHDWD